jgi:hypothetical protein
VALRYPLRLTSKRRLTSTRIDVVDSNGLLVAVASGPALKWKERLTLYGIELGGPILAEVRAESPGAFPSYTITHGDGRPLGSLRARSFSLLTQKRDLLDAGGAAVGTVTGAYRRRKLDGAATRVPIVGAILRLVEVLDRIFTIEMPAGIRVLEARYIQALSGHRFEVRQLGDITRNEDLILPTLAILLETTFNESVKSSG